MSDHNPVLQMMRDLNTQADELLSVVRGGRLQPVMLGVVSFPECPGVEADVERDRHDNSLIVHLFDTRQPLGYQMVMRAVMYGTDAHTVMTATGDWVRAQFQREVLVNPPRVQSRPYYARRVS